MNNKLSSFGSSRPGKRLGVVCAAVLLAACGGGDGGTPFTPLDFPFDSVMSTYWQVARVHNLSNAGTGGNVAVRIERTPVVGGGNFEGRASLVTAEVATFTVAGVADTPITGRSFYTASPYVSLGAIDDDNGEYTVSNQTANLPARATVGQNGPLGTAITYTDATKTQVVESTVNTWSVEADTATTALLCINQATPLPPVETVSECLRVDTAGTVLGMVLRYTDNTGTLVLR